MWIALIPSKHCASKAVKRIRAETEARLGKKLSCHLTDRGGEFNSTNINEHYVETRVQRQLTALYSPQENGMVEQRNQSVIVGTGSTMKANGLPGYF
jgi:transposase InsO family protein